MRELSLHILDIAENSVQANAKKIEVCVEEDTVSDQLRIVIKDNGKGMNKQQISTLFSRFKTRNANENDGTGIGLAIAKSIADFHGIEILVDSVVNKGTCFSFVFSGNS